ncbi:hypothetical protein Bpla01_47970 [Burkholderia plantarii]|nr:hypothetical protein Bpla01_47970 [Burkholderia plantarii]
MAPPRAPTVKARALFDLADAGGFRHRTRPPAGAKPPRGTALAMQHAIYWQTRLFRRPFTRRIRKKMPEDNRFVQDLNIDGP